MIRHIFIIFILSGCLKQEPVESITELNEDIQTQLIESWLAQNKYSFDSLHYSTEIVFSNGYGPIGFMNLDVIPKVILRDSILIVADSIKINKTLNSKYRFDTTKHKIQFFFSNFLFDSTKTIAMSNLSIFYLNKTEDRILGGEEKTIVYLKENNQWNIKNEVGYLDY